MRFRDSTTRSAHLRNDGRQREFSPEDHRLPASGSRSVMTIRDKILASLRAKDRLCDDCLSELTGVRPRQAVNAECRVLSSLKLIQRIREDCARCGRTKIVNRVRAGGASYTAPRANHVRPANRPKEERPWYWEGNVQRKIVEFLQDRGFTLQSEADTASREKGKDIVARSPEGQLLWVTVKGFPEKSKNTQARHWFAGAHHDLARYRNEDGNVLLAMGLPHGFKTYERLVKRDDPVRRFLDYSVFWVEADGTVKLDAPPAAS